MSRKFLHTLCDGLWDLWCLISVVGIWPRWIEPRSLSTTRLNVRLDPGLKGLKIVLFSDLHLHTKTPESLLKKITQKTRDFAPDLVVFVGDFLCYSKMGCHDRFHSFFNAFSAPLGCYAALGNHDYDQTVGLNEIGEYAVLPSKKQSFIISGLKRLFSTSKPTGIHSENLATVGFHRELGELLAKTPFRLLHNETVQASFKDTVFNITGVGEYTMNQCKPDIAFKEFKKDFSGIVLAHNPDAIKHLVGFPGDLILSGHTHGGQINLPWIWKKLTVLENMRFKKGSFRDEEKHIYVTRGIGSVFSFRWFSPPELVLITLE
jgi:predicted MPP superfamily phosphohydrolase